MFCPVHFSRGCDCRWARRPRLLPIAIVLTSIVACGPRPDVCSERDAQLMVNEAQCLARVKTECAGIPLDQPCPFEEECKRFTRERCK